MTGLIGLKIDVKPRPSAGGFFCATTLVIAALQVIAGFGLARACCSEETPPISNCSFSYNDNKENVFCEVLHGKPYGYASGFCPDYYGFTILDDIPAPVYDIHVEPFTTSCRPTIKPYALLATAPQNTSCSNADRNFYAGINVTFRVDKHRCEKLEAIEISLRRFSNPISHRVWCHELHIGRATLKSDAADQHLFYFDGFIGLEPTVDYGVYVTTLPSTIHRDNEKQLIVTIPTEQWTPELEFHDTPSAVNFTLFQDSINNFTEFEILVATDRYYRKFIDFNNAVLYNLHGKLGTNVLFDCLQPTETGINVFIHTVQCPYCDWYRTQVVITATPPSVQYCPSNITRVVELGSADVVQQIDWRDPVFQSKCGGYTMQTNGSHDPMTSVFRVGTETLVSYSAWQHGKVAECSFYVVVSAVDTTPPNITSCPADVRLTAGPRNSLAVTWAEPEADDASPIHARPSRVNGSRFPVGNTTVTYEIVDDSGNRGEDCVFHVYIEETPRVSVAVILSGSFAGLAVLILVAGLIFKQKWPIKLPSTGCASLASDVDGPISMTSGDGGIPLQLLMGSSCSSLPATSCDGESNSYRPRSTTSGDEYSSHSLPCLHTIGSLNEGLSPRPLPARSCVSSGSSSSGQRYPGSYMSAVESLQDNGSYTRASDASSGSQYTGSYTSGISVEHNDVVESTF